MTGGQITLLPQTQFPLVLLVNKSQDCGAFQKPTIYSFDVKQRLQFK